MIRPIISVRPIAPAVRNVRAVVSGMCRDRELPSVLPRLTSDREAVGTNG